MKTPHNPSWVERHAGGLFWALVLLCAALLAAQPFVAIHPHFEIDKLPGFYALFGFLSFVFIVFVGKALRRLIMRDEDYYDRR